MDSNSHIDPATFDWNDIYSGTPSDYEPPDALMLELIAELPAGRALDVGCGAGGLLIALAKSRWRVAGIDIAAKAIAAARQVFADHKVVGELTVADAGTWQPTGQFDLVTNSFALPLTREERTPVYAMIRDALAPGGTVVIKDFDPAMRRLSPFSTMDMVAVEELTEAFAGFDVLRAEIVTTPVHAHSNDRDGGPWTAALLHARKPA